MREYKLKAIDDFDKKLYEVTSIDFRRKKLSIHFRGNLENSYDLDEIHVIQSTELLDIDDNEIYESDLLSDGINTYCISYDKKKGSYIGINIKNSARRSLHFLVKKKYKVIGNYYM